MNVLALESATTSVGVAVVCEAGATASLTLGAGRHQAETLHPAVVTVLEAAGLALGDLDAVVVDVGPGLFTGIRVGVAAAKGFGLGLSLPVVPVLSTEVLIAAAPPGDVDVLAMVDLRRGDLAVALRRCGDGSDAPEPPRLTGLAELAALLASYREGEVLVVGDGLARNRAALEAIAGERLPTAWEGAAVPSPAVLGAIGLQRLTQGEGRDALSLEACYLKEADVRISWETRGPIVSAAHDAPGAG